MLFEVLIPQGATVLRDEITIVAGVCPISQTVTLITEHSSDAVPFDYFGVLDLNAIISHDARRVRCVQYRTRDGRYTAYAVMRQG